MIHVDLLKHHESAIPELIKIWYDVFGKIWVPEIDLNQAKKKFREFLNEDSLPLTFVALDGDKPIGMCSLRKTEMIRSDLGPWLGFLAVDAQYQKRGIGRRLMQACQNKARELGYTKLYLFAFDLTIPNYYARLGWTFVGEDEFRNRPVTVMEIDLLKTASE